MHYDTVLQQAFARGLRTHANDLPVTCKQSLLLGRYLLSEYSGYFYSKSHNLARELCKAYDRALEDYDVLLMPAVPRKAQALPLANLSMRGESFNPIQTGLFWIFSDRGEGGFPYLSNQNETHRIYSMPKNISFYIRHVG